MYKKTIQTRISRSKLKNECYLPDEIIVMQENPLDHDLQRRNPTIKLLKIMYEQI